METKKKYIYPPEKQHEYYINFKNRNSERIREKHTCEICGGSYSLQTKSKHNATIKHQKACKTYCEDLMKQKKESSDISEHQVIEIINKLKQIFKLNK